MVRIFTILSDTNNILIVSGKFCRKCHTSYRISSASLVFSRTQNCRILQSWVIEYQGESTILHYGELIPCYLNKKNVNDFCIRYKLSWRQNEIKILQCTFGLCPIRQYNMRMLFSELHERYVKSSFTGDFQAFPYITYWSMVCGTAVKPRQMHPPLSLFLSRKINIRHENKTFYTNRDA